jgi:SOS response regulatory protein OraA/RecX
MEAEFNRAYAVAVSALSKRELLEPEVRIRLSQFAPEIVDLVIEKLLSKGLVNDRRVCESLVSSRQGKRAEGSPKLRETLERRGATSALITEALGDTDDWLASMSLLRARFRPEDGEIGRAGRLLYSRGFDEETIGSVLSQFFGRAPDEVG